MENQGSIYLSLSSSCIIQNTPHVPNIHNKFDSQKVEGVQNGQNCVTKDTIVLDIFCLILKAHPCSVHCSTEAIIHFYEARLTQSVFHIGWVGGGVEENCNDEYLNICQDQTMFSLQWFVGGWLTPVLDHLDCQSDSCG